VIEQVKRGEKTINAALSERTPKEQSRRKIVAKESEPEEKFIKVEQRWEPEIVAMTEWWDTMPTAYRQLTNGEEVAGCLKISVTIHSLTFSYPSVRKMSRISEHDGNSRPLARLNSERAFMNSISSNE